MKISRNSNHYKFNIWYDDFFGCHTPTEKIKSFCIYFWKTLFRFFFLPVSFIVNILLWFIPYTPRLMFDEKSIINLPISSKLSFFGLLCMVFLLISTISVIFGTLFIATMQCFIYGFFTFDSATIICFQQISCIILFFAFLLNRLGSDSFFPNKFKAYQDRVCPIIEFV